MVRPSGGRNEEIVFCSQLFLTVCPEVASFGLTSTRFSLLFLPSHSCSPSSRFYLVFFFFSFYLPSLSAFAKKDIISAGPLSLLTTGSFSLPVASQSLIRCTFSLPAPRLLSIESTHSSASPLVDSPIPCPLLSLTHTLFALRAFC